MDSIDKLLAELQTEYKEGQPQQQQPKSTTAKSFIHNSNSQNQLQLNRSFHHRQNRYLSWITFWQKLRLILPKRMLLLS